MDGWFPNGKIAYQGYGDKFASEEAMMNRMLEQVSENDWVLWIDTDEELVGDVRHLVEQAEMEHSTFIPMRIMSKGEILPTLYCRLYKMQEGLVHDTHHSVKIGDFRFDLLIGPIQDRGGYIGHSPNQTFSTLVKH
jgi:hypothetical protein